MKQQYYSDFKWLSQQIQWKTFQTMLEEDMQKLINRFLSDSTADLKNLQATAMELNRIKNSVKNVIEEYEYQLKEQTK